MEVGVQLNKEGMPNCMHEYFLLHVPPVTPDIIRHNLHGKDVFLATRVTSTHPFDQQDSAIASFGKKFY